MHSKRQYILLLLFVFSFVSLQADEQKENNNNTIEQKIINNYPIGKEKKIKETLEKKTDPKLLQKLQDINKDKEENSAKYNQDIKINNQNIFNNSVGKQALKNIQNYKKNKKIQQQVKKYTDEILANFNQNTTQQNKKEQNEDILNDFLSLGDKELFIFVSSSIPNNVIKNYLQDIETLKSKDIYVTFIGFKYGINKIKEHFAYIHTLLKKDANCKKIKDCEYFKNTIINIDPLKFGYFDIEKVPAFVLAKKREWETLIPNTKADPKDFLVLYGNIDLREVLEKFYNYQQDENIKKAIKRLQNAGFYKF